MRKKLFLLALLLLLASILGACKELPGSGEEVPGWKDLFYFTPDDDLTQIPGFFLLVSCAVGIGVLLGIAGLVYALLEARNTGGDSVGEILAVLFNGFSVFINAALVLLILRSTGSVGEALVTRYPGFLETLVNLGVDLSINPIKIFADISILGITLNAPLIINGWRAMMVILAVVSLWYGAVAVSYKGLLLNGSLQVGWVMSIIFYFILTWFLGGIAPTWDFGAKQAGIASIYAGGFVTIFTVSNIIFPAIVFWQVPKRLEPRVRNTVDQRFGRSVPDTGSSSDSDSNGSRSDGGGEPPPRPRSGPNGEPSREVSRSAGAALLGAVAGSLIDDYLEGEDDEEDEVEFMTDRSVDSSTTVEEGRYEEISENQRTDRSVRGQSASDSSTEEHSSRTRRDVSSSSESTSTEVEDEQTTDEQRRSVDRRVERSSEHGSHTESSVRGRAAGAVEFLGGIAARSGDRRVAAAGEIAKEVARRVRSRELSEQEDSDEEQEYLSETESEVRKEEQSYQRTQPPDGRTSRQTQADSRRAADSAEDVEDDQVETLESGRSRQERPSEGKARTGLLRRRKPPQRAPARERLGETTPDGMEFLQVGRQPEQDAQESRDVPQGTPKRSSPRGGETEYLSGPQPASREDDEETDRPRRDVLSISPERDEEHTPSDVEYLGGD